jgi:hypothetical protein
MVVKTIIDFFKKIIVNSNVDFYCHKRIHGIKHNNTQEFDFDINNS